MTTMTIYSGDWTLNKYNSEFALGIKLVFNDGMESPWIEVIGEKDDVDFKYIELGSYSTIRWISTK